MPLESVISIMFEMLNTEQLRDLRGTSRELCAVVSDDPGWILKYHEMVDGFELSENEMVEPLYPMRDRGEQHVESGFLPLDAKDYYKARPLPLRCTCCKVDCDSYVSFTEHCTLTSHKKKMDPSTIFDPRFTHERYNDPRHNAGFDELSMMMKCRAMDHYKFHMKCFFFMSRPVHKTIKAPWQSQRVAWKNMKECAKRAREDLIYDNNDGDIHDSGDDGSDSDDAWSGYDWGLTDKELHAICRKCTPERAVGIWTGIIFDDFKRGLQGAALEVVQHGWKTLEIDRGCDRQGRFMAGMTGLEY
jgi:hypothetical protein